jgi:hypothetical protein
MLTLQPNVFILMCHGGIQTRHVTHPQLSVLRTPCAFLTDPFTSGHQQLERTSPEPPQLLHTLKAGKGNPPVCFMYVVRHTLRVPFLLFTLVIANQLIPVASPIVGVSIKLQHSYM